MNAAPREARHCSGEKTVLGRTSVAALLLAACMSPSPAGNVVTAGQAAVLAGRPECPTDSVIVTLKGSERQPSVPTLIKQVAVSGDISLVPEYHDCQRLALGAGSTYGPLAAVFAARRLDTLFLPSARATSMAAARAAGEILVYDGQYKPLELMPGFSCLYLWEPSKGKWEALIQAVGINQDACLSPPSSGYPQWRLKARPVPPPEGQAPADIPPVARWDWDVKHHRHYIRIRCGDQWCAVAGKKFQSSSSHTPGMRPPKPVPGKPDPTEQEIRRVIANKGWYDEQRLAVGGAAGTPLTVSTLTGTAFPHPLLGTLDKVDDFNKWIPVATVRLAGPPPGDPAYVQYKQKLNFDPGDNEVELCRSMSKPPSKPDSELCVPEGMKPSTTCVADKDGSLWWARIISQTDTAYRCVTRRAHPEAMPGTVRWRWLLNDETLWVRCSFGCCTVEP